MKKQQELLNLLKQIVEFTKQNPKCLEKTKKRTLFQKDNLVTPYDFVHRHLLKVSEYSKSKDREIPIDTTTLNEINVISGTKVERVKIMYGPNSDEMARNYHANAFTIGNIIYLRNKAYKPETEEGRKLLAHEFTHIQQNQEDILEGQKTIEELEQEAETAELNAEYPTENFKYFNIGEKRYKVTEKQYNKIMNRIRDQFEQWLTDNDDHVSEEEQLRRLLAYEKMEEHGELPWQK